MGSALPWGCGALRPVSVPLMLLHALVSMLMRSFRRICGYLSGGCMIGFATAVRESLRDCWCGTGLVAHE